MLEQILFSRRVELDTQALALEPLLEVIDLQVNDLIDILLG